MGTSLSFYKGYDFNEQLKDTIRAATGLPATTMSTGVVEGLRALGVRHVAVGTAYIDEVNHRLRQFLVDSGFQVGAVQGLGIDLVGEAKNVSEADLVALGQRALAASPCADGILILCGGLRTLGVTVPLEAASGVPVVSSTPARLLVGGAARRPHRCGAGLWPAVRARRARGIGHGLVEGAQPRQAIVVGHPLGGHPGVRDVLPVQAEGGRAGTEQEGVDLPRPGRPRGRRTGAAPRGAVARRVRGVSPVSSASSS